MELWSVSLVLLGVFAVTLIGGLWIAISLLCVAIVAMAAFTNAHPAP